MQIARINQMFDYKIQQIRNSYFMSRWDKQRQIRSLEQQRHMEIRMVYAKFSNRNRYDDRNRGYDNNRGYDRNDNSGRQY